MKGILHDGVRVRFVDFLQNGFRIGVRQRCDEHEFGPCLHMIVKGHLGQLEVREHVPVAVSRIVNLKVSPEITCAPELDPVGDKRLVMACIP